MTSVNNFLTFLADTVFSGETVSCLLCSGTLTNASTLTTITAAEVSGNGYTRQTAVASAASYDGTDTRSEVPQLTFTFTASGGSIVYNTVVIAIGDPSLTYAVKVESIGETRTIFNGASHTYVYDAATQLGIYA